MADATAKSALVGHMAGGRHGAAETGGMPGVVLSEVRGRALVHVAGPEGGLSTGDGTRALRLGPDQWLVKAPGGDARALIARLAADAPGAAVNDVTHGRSTVHLAGPAARDVLAAGCPLDLHESVFAKGQCAASLLGHLQAVIECVDADAFEITVTRSYGQDLLEWLMRAAAADGFEINS